MIPRALRIAAAAAIAAAVFQPFYIRVFALNRARMAANLVEMPYRKTPGLRPFLERVRACTQRGDAVAIAAPFAYEYVSARADYVLAGREVLPMREAARARFIAVYRGAGAPPGFAIVFRDANGVLLRRAP